MKQTFRPIVDMLENRWVPALLLQLDASGNLTGIFGVPDGDVLLEVTADNEVRVEENLSDLGTYSVPGNLTVSLGNVVAATALDVDMSTGTSLSGNVSMTLGNALGGYAVTVTGDGATSSIFGNLKVKTGSGNDSISVTDMVIGGSANLDADGGADGIFVTGTDVGGNLSTANAGGSFDDGTVEGSLRHTMTEGLGASWTLGVDSVVLGNATLNMTAGSSDSVTLSGVVEGNVVANMRGGANDLVFDVDATILGSFTYTGGNGVDEIDFDGTLGGNFTSSLGGGADDLEFDGAVVLGSAISIVAGNGDDLFTSLDLTAPGARLTFLGGNGADTVDWSAAIPAVASAYLDGGLGVDSCDLTGGTIDFPFTKRNFP